MICSEILKEISSNAEAQCEKIKVNTKKKTQTQNLNNRVTLISTDQKTLYLLITQHFTSTNTLVCF